MKSITCTPSNPVYKGLFGKAPSDYDSLREVILFDSLA